MSPGPRTVPLHLNGVEIGVVKEPHERSVEDQAFTALVNFAHQIYGLMFRDAGHMPAIRKAAASHLLRSLGCEDSRGPRVLSHLKVQRRPDGGLVGAWWLFDSRGDPPQGGAA